MSNPSPYKISKPRSVDQSSPIGRWENENMTEQPYHGIERVAVPFSFREEFAAGGGTCTNGAVAGSRRSS